MAEFYRWQGDHLILNCHLQPKASNDGIVGLHGDSLKIRITAPPIEGKANAHLIKFLAKQFGVPKSAISIISGELGRQKRDAALVHPSIRWHTVRPVHKISQPGKIPENLSITASD